VERYARRMYDRFGLRPSLVTKRHIAAAKTYADAEKLVEAEARRAALEKVLRS
jgi:hypothetical protein